MSRPLRLLMIEDSEDDAKLLLMHLKRAGFDPVHERVETVDGMATALVGKAWDILISDHSMPHFTPNLAIEKLQELKIDLPVIIVSGTIEPGDAVAAMKAGASDYIMKGDLTRLTPAIERELREAQNRQARRSAEEQARQAQKMESVGRLAGGVAHDFNNILTAILGYSNFLQKSLEPSDGRADDLREIVKAAQRAAGLTKQLLAFSRRQVLEPKVVDLNVIVTNIQKMLRRLIGEDIELATKLEPVLWSARVDPGQMEQVIMNLALNARDAMEKGGTITTLTANVVVDKAFAQGELSIPPGEYVLLSISDTGIGMDADTLARVFEPFFTTKEPGKGTGLGLSMVYGIVKQSGGHIGVESRRGEGAMFKLYFPRVKAAQDQIPASPSAARPLAGSETILLVEDEDTVRSIARRVLESHGYEVIEARSGAEALRLCRDRERPVHLLLADLVLPGLDGIELAKELLPARPGLKVLYMSGYTDRAVFRDDVVELRTSFVQKPFTPDSLARKVRDTLDG